LLWLG